MVLFGEPGPLKRQADRHHSMVHEIPFLSFFLLLVTQGRVLSAGIGAMATGDEQKPGDCIFTGTNQAWTRTCALLSTTRSHVSRFYIWKLPLLPASHAGIVSSACYYKLQLRQHRQQTHHEVLVFVVFLVMLVYFVCVCLGGGWSGVTDECHCMHVDVRAQLVEAGSLFLPRGSQRSSSGHQAR